MRCSSFEPLLDEFVDGTLPPVPRRRVLAHVDRCTHCQGLLEELRVIDALLIVPRQLEPAPNFTFRTMADVRSLPMPRMHRTPTLPVIATYLVFAWTAIAAWLFLGGQTSRATVGFLANLGMHYGSGMSALAHATARLFGVATPDVGVAMGAVLLFDVGVALVLVLAYLAFRPRARRAGSSEVSP